VSKICIIGAGYVGLVTAACFTEMGHRVTIIEIDNEKVHTLNKGTLPVHEAGLPELWQRSRAKGDLEITGSYAEGLKDREFAFIAVGTPSGPNGKPDLKWVRLAARNLAENASASLIVVMKSTVPVGAADLVAQIIRRYKRIEGVFPIVSNPEFLREGMAVFDFLHPTRIVIGSADKSAVQAVARLYTSIEAPLFTCDNRSAEMSKYASNVFLANRISFMNEISLLCDEMGVDVVQISRIVGLEPRCGEGYLSAGLGWGGSCLPKDVKGLLYMGKSHGVALPLITAVQQINQRQIQVPVKKLQRLLGPLNGKTIGILGLAFKPNSDDLRQASSLSLIPLLKEHGCHIKAYDPVAMEGAHKLIPSITYCRDSYQAAENSDALILVTEWDEFRNLDLARMSSLMRTPVLIDGRNFYDPEQMVKAGFIYEGIGRSRASASQSVAALLERKKELQPVLAKAAGLPDLRS
jgi:UDPglucose 6-dehydrogenase